MRRISWALLICRNCVWLHRRVCRSRIAYSSVSDGIVDRSSWRLFIQVYLRVLRGFVPEYGSTSFFLNVRRPVVLMEYYWYRLLFNLVSPAKVHWETEIRTKRESYYVSYQWIKPHWPLKLQGRTWSAGYLTKYQASLPHQRIKSFSHWWNH